MDDLDELKKEELEEVKLRTEIRKVRLETHELQTPIWERPTIWAAVVPLLIAAYGGWKLVQTDFFNNQRTLLQIDTNRLEDRKKELEGQIATRSADLSEKEKQVDQLETDYRKRSEDLDTRFQSEKTKIEGQLADLRLQQQQERERLLAAVAASPVDTQIEALERRMAPIGPNISPLLDLVNLLTIVDQHQQDRIARAKERYQQINNRTAKAAIAFALYRGTKDVQWRDALIALYVLALQNDGGQGRPSTLDPLVESLTGLSDSRPVVQAIMRALRMLSDRTYAAEGVTTLLAVSRELGPAASVELSTALWNIDVDGYLATVATCRDSLLNQLRYPFGSIETDATALARISPHALMSLIGLYLSDIDHTATTLINNYLKDSALKDTGLRVTLPADISIPPSDPKSQIVANRLNMMVAARTVMGFPLTHLEAPARPDQDEWLAWYHKNETAARLWLESDLHTFHADHALLQAEMRRWHN
jgi:hypothetical protein